MLHNTAEMFFAKTCRNIIYFLRTIILQELKIVCYQICWRNLFSREKNPIAPSPLFKLNGRSLTTINFFINIVRKSCCIWYFDTLRFPFTVWVIYYIEMGYNIWNDGHIVVHSFWTFLSHYRLTNIRLLKEQFRTI